MPGRQFLGLFTAGNAASVTIYGFKPGPDSNRMLVLAVETNNQAVSTTTKPTFGSQTFVQSAHHFTHDDTEFWYLTNPSSASHDITITFQGTTGFVAGVYAFSGVNQTSPIATTATNVGSSGNPTISLTTKYYNSWVLDSPSIYGGSTLSSPTCIQQWDVNRASQVTGASSYVIPIKPQSTTCTWTNSVGTNGWDDSAVEVRSYNPSTGVLIPLYNDPPLSGSKQWTNATNSHNAYSSVRMIAIVNYPPNGDDVLNDTSGNWTNGVKTLQSAGIIVLGYVHTNYGCQTGSCSPNTSPQTLSHVEAAMSNYSKYYHVNGTFFDEMSNYPNTGPNGNLTYYGKLSNYSKYTLNQTYTVGNPGTESNYSATVPFKNFNTTFDTLNIFETNQSLPCNPNSSNCTPSSYDSWNANFNKNLFSVLAWAIPSKTLNSTYYNNTSKQTGYLYFTDNTGCYHNQPVSSCWPNNNPWNTTATYLNSTLGNLTHFYK